MTDRILVLSILILGLYGASALHAQPDREPAKTLDELLERVAAGRHADNAVNRKRLERFVQARDEQQAMLAEARARTARLEDTGERLNTTISELDREITLLEEQLSQRLGNFGELFGVTRQVAGETRSQVGNSLISAQFPGRDEALQEIAASRAMPTMEQLRRLWTVLLQEQTEQGKVARFSAVVSNEHGDHVPRDVIRVGPFSAVSSGDFLAYNSAAGELTHLARQPASRYTKSAARLSDADPGERVGVAVDPSRGTILGLLVKAPNLFERFKQGGIPGYAVTILAVIGLSIGVWRLLSLSWTSARVRRQMQSRKIDPSNPLGRVLSAYEENRRLDVEALERKLDDAVLQEVPALDRGLNTLKVLAAVAPLIGLLGTVIGMILTFQAITLWGTGDPKIMAGGISQALVTTAQGLIAAIPLLLLHSLASGRARLVQEVLEEQSAGLVARRAEKVHG